MTAEMWLHRLIPFLVHDTGPACTPHHHGLVHSAIHAPAPSLALVPPESTPARVPVLPPSSPSSSSAAGGSPSTEDAHWHTPCLPGRTRLGRTCRVGAGRVVSRKGGLARRSHDRSAHTVAGGPPRAHAGRDSRRRWDSIRIARRIDTPACDEGYTRADTRTLRPSCIIPSGNVCRQATHVWWTELVRRQSL